ncbi:MAG: DUF4189 domain-containing protein [Gemmatimonadota bacterium]|nr:DUF4189 domain-containing protein [Gemmatimonadota bacterium]
MLTTEWIDYWCDVHEGRYRKQLGAAIIELPDFFTEIREAVKRINVEWTAFTAFLFAAALVISPVSAAGVERWWAVALEDKGKDWIQTGLWRRTYGASWNFPTEEEAARAALKECQKRTKQGCFVRDTSNKRCLAVMQSARNGLFEDMLNQAGGRIAVTIEAASDVRRVFADLQREYAYWELEMYHCPATQETWTR